MKNKTVREVVIYILILLLVILCRTFVFSLIKVNGSSMINTLHNKDIMILNKIYYKYNDIKRFDIVVIDDEKDYIIKRVIGLPGETVEYIDNELYINGKKIKEKFSHKDTDDYSLDKLDVDKIPKDYYFVLGDNRKNSMDSRIIGLIPKKKILGRAKYTLLPISRFGSKK